MQATFVRMARPAMMTEVQMLRTQTPVPCLRQKRTTGAQGRC
eukprot:COSAG02_NODE_1632_length_11568_cov_4.882640_4_plen_42_part_00